MDKIKEKLSLLPYKPGCYLMKNKCGVVIYVGKAKKLKNRVSSYFRGTHTGKTARLVSEIDDFEYVVVGSETESLILEINLIKKYDPKYNILLRDDKSYPYIELTNEESPRLKVVRSLNKKKTNKSRLFGPYPNATAAREVVNLLNRVYPLRKCDKYPKKTCLYYHINQCLGYCVYDIEKEKIDKITNEITRFLKGDCKPIIEKLTNEMLKYSNSMNFEKAKEIKDMIDYINITLTKQKVEIQDSVDTDVFGFFEKKGYLSIQLFFIRGGKIVSRSSNVVALVDSIEEELTRFIAKFYDGNVLLPKQILVPEIVDNLLLQDYLKVNVKKPIKGVLKKIVDMACDNAHITLDEQFELIKRNEDLTIEANRELGEILNIPSLNRIELFDNSHLFGSFSVSGMVVFTNGKPNKNEYRKYKIKIDTNDEYGMMKEVIYRRYFRVLKDDLERPDLIIVDGGIGQINVARDVLKSLNMDIPVIGLRKNDKHITDGLLAFDPIKELDIDKKTNLFYYLERMQDEVHNFTINYHKQIRSKGALSSVLDNIEGIGKARKEMLLKKYKSISKIRELSVEELSSVLPKNIASNLLEFLKENL